MKKQAAMKFTGLPSLLCLAVSLTLIVSSAHAKGGKDGGGADYIQNNYAWFVSSDSAKRIQTCIEVAPGFSVPKDVIASSIQESFQKWGAAYRTAYKAAYYSDPGSNTPQIVTAVNLTFGCKGGEDLRFFFGATNRDIEARKVHYKVPFAFAETNQLPDPDGEPAKWTPGMIWIAPDKSVLPQSEVPTWTAQAYHPFKQLLIHEIGHVMGVGHIDGTLMGMRLMNDLVERTQRQPHGRTGNEYGKRDLEIEQYSILFVGENFQTDMIFPQESETTGFKRLVGRAPVGKVKVTTRRLDKSGSRGAYYYPRAPHDVKITLTDDLGITSVTLYEKMKIAEDRNRSAPIFLTPGGGNDFQSFAFAGVLRTATGEELMVTSNYNQNYTRYEILDLSPLKELGTEEAPSQPILISN